MNRPLSLRRSEYFFALCACAFLLINITWSLLANYTWDDDAIGRFQDTQIAGSNVYYFLDSWDRPFFVCTFYLSIHFFGRMGMVVQMTLMMLGAAYLLYKTAERKGGKNAPLVILFFLFQTFVFGMSRDAMTDPLVAILNCVGLYCLSKEKFLLFALVGAVLPLTRPEQVLLLPFWALALIRHKKFWLVPLLGWGIAAWWLGFYLYSGDPGAFLHELFKTGEKTNRYAHPAPSHYFDKYVYVVGPVFFYFFLLGYLIRVKNIFRDYFVLLQFTAGFLLYVIFSSFLDLGQAGGALRNMVTLSPFAALIGFDGFTYLMNLRAIPSPASKTRKKVIPPGNFLPRLKILAYIGAVLLVAYQFFSYKLKYRQNYDEDEMDYTILGFLLVCSLFTLALFAIKTAIVQKTIAVLFLLLQIGFVLCYENPYSHVSPERKAINDVSNMVSSTTLHEHRIFCNHPWFLWANGIRKTDISHVIPVDSAHLRQALPGDLVLWDSHYGGMPYGNVDYRYFVRDSSYVPLYFILTEENKQIGFLFLKTRAGQNYDGLYDEILQQYPLDKTIYALKGNYEQFRLKAYDRSVATYTKALELDGAWVEIIVQRGLAYLQEGNADLASRDFSRALAYGYRPAGPLLDKARQAIARKTAQPTN